MKVSSLVHSSKQKTILEKIITSFRKKDVLHKKRKDILDRIAQTMDVLIPLGQEVIHSSSAKSVMEIEEMYYTSAILHQGWNFLQGTKLFPDLIDFTADITVPAEERETIGKRLSKVHSLARRLGRYKQETLKAQSDLINGECYMYRDYEVDAQGRAVKLVWRHVKWENVRPAYDNEDEIIVTNVSLNTYKRFYGEKQFNKVTTGGLLGEFDDSDSKVFGDDKSPESEVIQIIRYINPAERIFVELHGGDALFYRELVGDDYPFYDTDGTPFSPLKRRVFYVPPRGNYHGWGILDMLLPVAKLDTSIANATANRAVLSADPLVVMASNDPEGAARLWRSHLRNRRNGETTPFFVSDTNTGTTMEPRNFDIGNTNANYVEWKNQLIADATMRTGIDFKMLTEFAPTAEQQRLRKLEQDKVNISIIVRNKGEDSMMAKEDVFFLKNTKSKFHNLDVYLEKNVKDLPYSSPETLALMKGENGKLPEERVKVKDVINSIKNIEFDIMPRLEGVFDDKTFMDIMSKRDDLVILQPNTMAYKKFATNYFRDAHPSVDIEEADFDPYVPPTPSQLMPEAGGNPVAGMANTGEEPELTNEEVNNKSKFLK